MKAIVRNNPGTLDNWGSYDSISLTSYSNLEEAIRGEESNQLNRVLRLIEDSEISSYQNAIDKHRILSENIIISDIRTIHIQPKKVSQELREFK